MKAFTIAIDQPRRSQAVIPALCRFAAPLQVPVSVLSIVPEPEQSDERHREIATICADENVDISVVAEESAADRLLEAAKAYPDNLLAVHTHARGAVGESIFGSIACHILRRSHVPLLFAGPGFDSDKIGRLRNIVVCLDGSETAETILKHVKDFALASGATVWIVQVLSERHADATHEHGYVRRVAKALQQEWAMDINWEVMHGSHVGVVISDYVRGDTGTMVAMTTHGRSGIGQFVAGSVAQTVVRHAGCPVMVMRP